jgi:hypothetical protein
MSQTNISTKTGPVAEITLIKTPGKSVTETDPSLSSENEEDVMSNSQISQVSAVQPFIDMLN